MRCYYCDYDTRIVKTREILDGHGITRTRECGGPEAHRFNTREQAPTRLDVTMLVVRQTGSGQLSVRFDPSRLFGDVVDGVVRSLTPAEISEVVENATAEISRGVQIHPLDRDEKLAFPSATGWVWDHQIADVVERQLQSRSRMAMVLYALSTRGRKDRPGRDGWLDATQVLDWLSDRYPTLATSLEPVVGTRPSQRWELPGGPAPVPTTIIKNNADDGHARKPRTFDREQFKRSIVLAVVGRFSKDEHEAMVESIAEWVLWGFAGQKTVLSSQISAGVLDCLRRLDDIAYLRWVAIVKRIESVAQFGEEAEGLVRWPSPQLELFGTMRHGRPAAER